MKKNNKKKNKTINNINVYNFPCLCLRLVQNEKYIYIYKIPKVNIGNLIFRERSLE